jgi:hypothetical protein
MASTSICVPQNLVFVPRWTANCTISRRHGRFQPVAKFGGFQRDPTRVTARAGAGEDPNAAGFDLARVNASSTFVRWSSIADTLRPRVRAWRIQCRIQAHGAGSRIRSLRSSRGAMVSQADSHGIVARSRAQSLARSRARSRALGGAEQADAGFQHGGSAAPRGHGAHARPFIRRPARAAPPRAPAGRSEPARRRR